MVRRVPQPKVRASDILETSELSEIISELSENLVHRRHLLCPFVTPALLLLRKAAKESFGARIEVQGFESSSSTARVQWPNGSAPPSGCVHRRGVTVIANVIASGAADLADRLRTLGAN
jgi:hypothetical protein